MLEYLLIGEITKPQGVHGELKLRPATCDVSRFEGLEYVYLQRDGEYVKTAVHVRKVNEDAVYLRMEGVETRNDAEELRGQLVYIDRAHAVELDEDTNFICDLIDLEGVMDDGTAVGRLIDVMQPGGNDVYVFKGARGEVLVPALRDVVREVDPRGGRIVLDAARMAEVAVYDDED